MKFFSRERFLPSYKNLLLAILAAILLTLAFPDYELWFLAYVALVPLFYAIERERKSFIKSFIVGWTFGIFFFFGTCWWLSFPMIHYASIPSPIAYLLVLFATIIVGIIPAIFCAFLSILLKRFGAVAVLSAPFLWTATEFLRFYVTGNNWNAIAYSQALVSPNAIKAASTGGVYLVGFLIILNGIGVYYLLYLYCFIWGKFLRQFAGNILNLRKNKLVDVIEIGEPYIFSEKVSPQSYQKIIVAIIFLPFLWSLISSIFESSKSASQKLPTTETNIIAVQPNVPMRGLKWEDRERLRERHVALSEKALQPIAEKRTAGQQKVVIIFPESPMNFEYVRDREFQEFLRNFTAKNNVSVLFNAAEPAANEGIYNSAVLVDEKGGRVAQYDKIHLLPFGEFVPLPAPVAAFVPPVVGNFEFGSSYDLLPLGNDIQAGVMICFESHFPTLSREFALRGADAIIEMTNDGYLGETPVLRQHLANAVFRAVETNRPVLRVTNVGITAFINERGEVLDATKPYTEDTRVWSISKSDGVQTFYVKYGDWFAWLCVVVSFGLISFSFWKRNEI